MEYLALASGVGPVINSGDVIYAITSTPSLVADVQSWLDNPPLNDGWILLGSSEGTAGTARRFSSTEVPGMGIGSALVPRITVDYTQIPEPNCRGLDVVRRFSRDSTPFPHPRRVHLRELTVMAQKPV